MLAHFEQAAFVFPVCLQICAPWMCLRALVLGGVRERERFRMQCALRRVCLHHVMLERARSVRV